MIDAVAFELGFQRLPLFGYRPHVLRPPIALLGAERASLQPASQQCQRVGPVMNSDPVAQRLARSRRTRWMQAEVSRVSFMFGISAVPEVIDQSGKSLLPCRKRFCRTEPPLRVERSSSQKHVAGIRGGFFTRPEYRVAQLQIGLDPLEAYVDTGGVSFRSQCPHEADRNSRNIPGCFTGPFRTSPLQYKW